VNIIALEVNTEFLLAQTLSTKRRPTASNQASAYREPVQEGQRLDNNRPF
jgi:hypothetical protein